MRANGNPTLMALIAAYCALASPVNTQPGQVQAVIDALKEQLKADNVVDASSVVDDAEASLYANGILNDDIIAKLNQEIQALTTDGGINVSKIAEDTVAYLNAKAAIENPDKEGAAEKTIVLDAATIKQVVDRGVQKWGGPCPDGSQASACCVIL